VVKISDPDPSGSAMLVRVLKLLKNHAQLTGTHKGTIQTNTLNGGLLVPFFLCLGVTL
jgi:hypothetical protein